MIVALGKWEDTFYDLEGNIQKVVKGENQAQNTQTTLTSALYRPGSTYKGIQYLAVGEGDPSWDITPPTLDPEDTTLLNETYRLPVSVSDSVYLDPDTESPTTSPTRLLELTVTLGTEIVGDLREFGLFGGNATTSTDSGYMVNWVSHAILSKTAEQIVTRRIKLRWLTAEEAVAFYCP